MSAYTAAMMPKPVRSPSSKMMLQSIAVPYPIRSRTPRMPCGRTISTTIRMASADRVLEVGVDPVGGHLGRDPDDESADHRAVGGAETAQDDRREHRQAAIGSPC